MHSAMILTGAAICSLVVLGGYGLLAKSTDYPFDGIRTFKDLNSFMEDRFIRENEVTVEEWESALPTDREKEDMNTIIQLMLMQKDWKSFCNDRTVRLYSALSGVMTLSPFLDDFCVLHEFVPDSGKFPRHFGYMVVKKLSSDVKNIHHSAAHFESDGFVCEQAAVLFNSTNSRTLVINGSSRFSIQGNPDSKCQKGNTEADAAHNENMMFAAMNEGIASSFRNTFATFIQWHGMAETSCSNSTAFVSLGATGSNSVYDDSGNIAEKIRSAFNKLSSTMVAGTPRSDSHCSLTATTNVFGRFVHGVPSNGVCNTKAMVINQKFIHIEQKRQSRDDHRLWTDVINQVFV